MYFLLFLRRSVFNLVLCGWENIAMRLKWLAFSKDLKQEGKEPMINTKVLCYDLFCRWDSVWKTYACSLSHLGSDEPIDPNTVCHFTMTHELHRETNLWERKAFIFTYQLASVFFSEASKNKQTNKIPQNNNRISFIKRGNRCEKKGQQSNTTDNRLKHIVLFL